MDPLLDLLERSTKKFPGIRFIWGSVAIAAAGGVMVKSLGEIRAAVCIWILSFLSFVLVTVFSAGSTGGSPIDRAPRIVLVYSTLFFYCTFMLFTISVFLGYGPLNWAKFIGVDGSKTEPFQVSGGSVYFGCQQKARATIQYVAQPGYHIIDVNAYPVDFYNTRYASAHIMENDGHRVIGFVEYSGTGQQFPNCSGGRGAIKLVGIVGISKISLLRMPAFTLMFAFLVSVGAIIFHRRHRMKQAG